MNFFKLLILSVVTAVQAKVLNFTQYESEWVKGNIIFFLRIKKIIQNINIFY